MFLNARRNMPIMYLGHSQIPMLHKGIMQGILHINISICDT